MNKILTLVIFLVTTICGFSADRSHSSGGSVQVKGYTRKDGTYVNPYTRRAPGGGSGNYSNDFDPISYGNFLGVGRVDPIILPDDFMLNYSLTHRSDLNGRYQYLSGIISNQTFLIDTYKDHLPKAEGKEAQVLQQRIDTISVNRTKYLAALKDYERTVINGFTNNFHYKNIYTLPK